MARKLATEILDPLTLETYVSCRLIPVDKNLGVRPIVAGEVLHRIVSKYIGWVLKEDIELAARPLQTATGLQSGMEAAIHSMRCMVEDDPTDAVILVDTRNAFSSLNRPAALHNIRVICPQIATILVNTYRRPACLIILGASDIYSLEGTMQGDNLAMAFYALGTTLLVNTLQITSPDVHQVRLADDISGPGSLDDVIIWLKNVILEGKKFGYLVNEKKSCLILKDHGNLQEAQRLFFNTSFKLTTNAQRHLGAAIGTSNFHANMPQKKSQNGAMNSTVLPTLQKHMQPIQHLHTMPTYKSIYINIHTIYIHIYQHTYSMRTILGMHEFIKPVDDVIRLELLPELVNSIVPEVDR